MKDIWISKDSKFPSLSLLRKIIILDYSSDSGREDWEMLGKGKKSLRGWGAERGTGSSEPFPGFLGILSHFFWQFPAGKAELKKVPSHFYPRLTSERGKSRLRLCRGEAANPESRFSRFFFSLIHRSWRLGSIPRKFLENIPGCGSNSRRGERLPAAARLSFSFPQIFFFYLFFSPFPAF